MTFKYEQEKYLQGYTYVIGCDEVGRGSLAGPVVACAVALPQVESEKFKVIKFCGIKDSKLLLPKKREELSEVIKQNCVAYGIGSVEPGVIDKINIHQATLLAMKKAVENLSKQINTDTANGLTRIKDGAERKKLFLFLDGKFCVPELNLKQEAVVKGDDKILSVAAASIVAKVHRDNLMRELHKQYPCYNFSQHKGYGTLHHRQMISRHGLSDVHRVSFCKQFTG